MKLDDIVINNNNRFLVNVLKHYINDTNDNKAIIIIGNDFYKYLEIINNTDNTIKLISDINKIKPSDFNSKIIIGTNNDKELNIYYDKCINKKEYIIVSTLESGLKLYIQ